MTVAPAWICWCFAMQVYGLQGLGGEPTVAQNGGLGTLGDIEPIRGAPYDKLWYI